MTAGLNLRLSITHYHYHADDSVGGAVPHGLTTYSDVQARLESKMPSQLLLEQGLETEKIFVFLVRSGTLDIHERDEVEITSPFSHKYYGKRFRVVGVTESNQHPSDPRTYLILNTVRSVEAHASQ